MCASRVGSILIEPFLKKIRFVVFSDYTDFLKAEGEDEKIQELLTTANFYRSVLGCLFSFLILSFGFWLVSENKISSQTMLIGVIGLVVILVLQGYKKQVSYIKKRVDYRKNNNANS